MSTEVKKFSGSTPAATGADIAGQGKAFTPDPGASAIKRTAEQAPRGPDLFTQSLLEAQDGDEGLHRAKIGSHHSDGDGDANEPRSKTDEKTRARRPQEIPDQPAETSAEDAITQALRKRSAAKKADAAKAVGQTQKPQLSIANSHDRLMMETSPLKRSEVATFMGAAGSAQLGRIFARAMWQAHPQAPDNLNSSQIEQALKASGRQAG